MSADFNADLQNFLAVSISLETQLERSVGASADAAERLLAKHSLTNLLSHLREASFGSDDVLVDLICRVLSRVLVAPRVLDGVSDCELLFAELSDGLHSTVEAIRISAVGFFVALAARQFAVPSNLREHLFEARYLDALCLRLSDESIAVSSAAVQAISALAGNPVPTARASAFLGPAVGHRTTDIVPPSSASASALVDALVTITQLVEISESEANSVILVRILGTVCAVAGASDLLCTLLSTAGLLQKVAEAVSSDDLLLQVSVLELLPPLAASSTGFKFLQTHVLPHLMPWAGFGSVDGGEDDDAPHPFLGNAAVSTIADIVCTAMDASGATETLAKETLSVILPGLMRCTSEACSHVEDPERVLVCTAALSRVMALSPGTIDAVLADTTLLREWLECGVSANIDLRTGVLSAVAAVLHGGAAIAAEAAKHAAPPSGVIEGAAALVDRYEQFFEALGRFCGRPTAEVALAALKRPEHACRHASYELLAAAAAMPGDEWLRRVFGAAPGVAAYILDRGTESDTAGSVLKFRVLSAAARNPALPLLGEPFIGAVREFVERGPHWRPQRAPQVATAS